MPHLVYQGASAKRHHVTPSRRGQHSCLYPRETAKSGSDVQSYVSDGNTRRKTRSSDGRRKMLLKALITKIPTCPTFSICSMPNEELFSTRGISHDWRRANDGDVSSCLRWSIAEILERRVKSDTQDKSQIGVTQLRQTSQRSIHKPDMASDPPEMRLSVFRVNFKPTTIAIHGKTP
ncbi:hypothetical protein ACHAWO_011214 [Cyclotella atomus]|uniref:Uncharacterized protein n=1 Tax=Cyclotella atomus TaxID=382360 RepID=A0ABD3NU15_9STRA